MEHEARSEAYDASEFVVARPLSDTESDRIVDAHNEWRRRVREEKGLSEQEMPDLVWSQDEADDAQGCANHLGALSQRIATHCTLSGENVCAWPGGLTPEEVVNQWCEDERENYLRVNEREIRPGDSDLPKEERFTHYTQVVWQNTLQVGCGRADSNGWEYWVCRYYPDGNRHYHRPYPVDGD